MSGIERYDSFLLNLLGDTRSNSYHRSPYFTQTWLTTLVWDSCQSEKDGIMEPGVESSNNLILYPNMSH